MKARPEDWTRVVAAHAHDTKAFIVTSSDPMCLKMAADEVKHIKRWMKQAVLNDLPTTLPPSWFMAVIVCPGDDMGGLADWMARHGEDRVRFYLHKDAGFRQLEPIQRAGHQLRHVRPEKYATYGALHKRLGPDLSDQIYEDFRPL